VSPAGNLLTFDTEKNNLCIEKKREPLMINKVLSKTLMPFFTAAVLAAFSACGDEITEVTQIVGMQVVEEGDALPKCTTDNEGALVYSVDSAAAYYCVNRKWTTMKGKDGKDGVDGKDGKNGVDGKNGKDGKNGVDGKNGENGKDGNDGKNGKNGENGKDGSDGKSCTVVAIDNGYKIVCGEDSVGVLLNGEDGQDGAKGDTGVAGTSCSAEKVTDGIKISCTDGKSVTLSNGIDGKDGKNCEIVSDLNGVITLKCGDDITKLYKAMCNLTPYDPTQQYCSDQGIFDLEKCGDKLYNPESHLCDTRDGGLYRHVTIGAQIWMAENLNYKTDSSWCGGGSDENEGDCSKYGRLYTWSVAKNACPEGWRLPDTTEWNTLFTAVGGIVTEWGRVLIAVKILKSQTGWNSYQGKDGNGTDACSFSALPAGWRNKDGYFSDSGYGTSFWSAIEDKSGNAYNVYLNESDDAFLYWHYHNKSDAYSVRCLKD
jgi:uncharacterized protein (TIGR02145 family)